MVEGGGEGRGGGLHHPAPGGGDAGGGAAAGRRNREVTFNPRGAGGESGARGVGGRGEPRARARSGAWSPRSQTWGGGLRRDPLSPHPPPHPAERQERFSPSLGLNPAPVPIRPGKRAGPLSWMRPGADRAAFTQRYSAAIVLLAGGGFVPNRCERARSYPTCLLSGLTRHL